MPPNLKKSSKPPRPSNKIAGRDDTESEGSAPIAGATHAGGDPLKRDVDKDKSGQTRSDRYRDPDLAQSKTPKSTSYSQTTLADPPRGSPKPAPQSQTSQVTPPRVPSKESSRTLPPQANPADDDDENHPLYGLSLVAKTFLNYNFVDDKHPPRFLHSSISYLRQKPQLIRDVDIADWRERARSALRTRNAELARKLIQQALLIELCQQSNYDTFQELLKQNPDAIFEAFIRQSYGTLLNYLEELQREGLINVDRKEILKWWETFVHWTCGEDISVTLSRSRGSVSATWISDTSATSMLDRVDRLSTTAGTSSRPLPAHHHSDVGGTLSGGRLHDDNPWVEARTSGTAMSSPVYVTARSSPAYATRAAGDDPSSPVYRRTTTDLPSTEARRERTISDVRPPRQEVDTTFAARRPTVPQETGHRYPATSVARKPIDPTRIPVRSQQPQVDLVHRPRVTKNPNRREYPDRREEQVNQDYYDDEEHEEEAEVDFDDGNDYHDDDDVTDERARDARDNVRGGPTQYEHVRGSGPPGSRPRHMATGTRNPVRTSRGDEISRPDTRWPQSSHSGNSRPAPSATSADSSGSQSVNLIQRLSGILGGFIAQRSFEECWEYFEENPELEREDLGPLQAIAYNYLRQGRREYASRVVERWLMLKDAISAPEGALENLKRLPQVPGRQTRLRQSCEIVIKDLERRIKEASTPSSDTGTSRQHSSGGSNTGRSNTQRTERTSKDQPVRPPRGR